MFWHCLFSNKKIPAFHQKMRPNIHPSSMLCVLRHLQQ
ncbi:hypothetical protein CIB84_013472 [Bambusicola thoracicus]|uniref:Uncharacterized protein n=1 Tax=Bambusicola thoracicus TaxID=9083 RepID=A0A2P4SF85_BAMTH|nr:hypothetical protein CIB84_013472 [Bambusicola thoracicus]